MTEREEREKHITVLEKWRKHMIYAEVDGDTRALRDALDYAISSIKTDLKYDLLYENEPIITLDELKEIREEIENSREDEKPHLCDYRYYRNEGMEKVLDILDKKISELEKTE